MGRTQKKAETLNCPRCKVIKMTFNEWDKFYHCPLCEGEFWLKTEFVQANAPPILVDKVIRETFEEDVRVGMAGPPKKKGGSKSGKKHKKPCKSSDWAGKFVEV